MTNTITILKDAPFVIGNVKMVLAQIDITSYTTNGEAIGIAQLGLGAIYKVFPVSSEKGYIPVWDEGNGKLKCMEDDFDAGANAPLIEAAAASDCGTFELLVLGTG